MYQRNGTKGGVPSESFLILMLKSRASFPQIDAEKQVHALITAILGYCNAVLPGCPNNPQKIFQLIWKAVAGVLTSIIMRECIFPVLASLYGLPVKIWTEIKVLLITYKALHGQAPSCLKNVFLPYNLARTLHSQNANLLVGSRFF